MVEAILLRDSQLCRIFIIKQVRTANKRKQSLINI